MKEAQAADTTLRLAMRDWLAAAPTYQMRTIAGEVDPADPAYSTVPMDVLTREDAVEDLAPVVNERALQCRCPERLMCMPGLPSQWDFEYLSFADVSPTLPTDYSSVLVRQELHFDGPGMASTTTTTGIGSVYQSPSTDVVVVWRT